MHDAVMENNELDRYKFFHHLDMYGCEAWTIMTDRRKIDAFELWCWRKKRWPDGVLDYTGLNQQTETRGGR